MLVVSIRVKMKLKRIIILCIVAILILSIYSQFVIYVEATTPIDNIITSMENTSNLNTGNHKITQGINSIIGLLQLAGTGISLIVFSMMGIKYILASPSEKAETKKMITPVIIGCILVFGSVNLIALASDFATSVLAD